MFVLVRDTVVSHHGQTATSPVLPWSQRLGEFHDTTGQHCPHAPLALDRSAGLVRILLIEDDTSIAAAIAATLRGQAHAVDHVEDGVLADLALQEVDYDLVILDLGLPRMDGAEVLRQLRGRHASVPVLVITARDGLDERVRVLDLGADDYLVKPFALAEFEARVRALLRRSVTGGANLVSIGRLHLDLPDHRAWVDEQPLTLTAREFGLIEALAARVNRVTNRAQLIEALCEWDQTLTGNGLDIAVHRVRRKLKGSGASVRTIRGLGYLLEEDPRA